MLGHFGFECLPHQLVNKSIEQGFSFNILCVGKCQTSPLNYYLIFPNAHFNFSFSTAKLVLLIQEHTFMFIFVSIFLAILPTHFFFKCFSILQNLIQLCVYFLSILC